MSLRDYFSKSSEVLMISFATGILLILFIPIPAALLDLLLIINFSWALTILLLTFYTDKPLSFSTFPALLLISTLFRLALNVSATRLILSDGDAGRVIGAIGQYVIHDNYVMGLVVFLILIIVQYVVVTNGAQRVAEVAARFTLDSMPGKQMSIDADLNMGLISQADAKFRRAQIEKEANFYGAMDGASKFVKGDAIAGVLIILVDLIGGFAIGMAQKGLSLSESIHTYSLLTVGDGLVTQIPALTISMATGIIVTRAATDAHLGREVASQVAAYPKSLLMVCCSLLSLLFLNGIPVIPVLIVLGIFALATFLAMRSNVTLTDDSQQISDTTLYEKIRIYPIEIQFNTHTFNELSTHNVNLMEHIQKIRERIAYDFGFVIPEVKLRAIQDMPYPYYAISIQGNVQEQHQLHLDKNLAITPLNSTNNKLALTGIAVNEPRYGLPATWISMNENMHALDGFSIHDSLSVLSGHLNEVVQQHLSVLLTRAQTEILISQEDISNIRDELIPALLPLGHVVRILQNLLQEHVSIRFLPIILDALVEHSKNIQDITQLTELVRARLATPICNALISAQNTLPVLTLAQSLEQKLIAALTNNALALEPRCTESFITSLAHNVERMLSARNKPVLLCTSALRRHIKQLTHRVIPHLTVLGMNEIPVNIHIESFAVVD